MRRAWILAAALCMASVMAAENKIDTAAAIVPVAPGTVFTQGEPLNFSLEAAAARPAKWVLADWQGRMLRSGEWPGEGKGVLTLAALPDGYYTLALETPGAEFSGLRSFAVVPDPAARRRNPDTFFALDSAQSWLARPNPGNVRHPQDGYATVSEAARRAGAEIVRERLSWNQCEPVPGKYSWDQFMVNAGELSKRGIQVSGMFHDSAHHAKGGGDKLPEDLAALYRFTRKLAETFKGRMTVWEFWNEQDHERYSTEPAWDYAAAMKAAYLGFKAGDPELPVAHGGIAIPTLLNYCNVMMMNGMKDYFDIFNIHTYEPLKDFPKLLDGIRAYLKRHGIADRPIWFTENGSAAEGPGRADSYIAGIKAHSPEQELLVAEYLPKMMIYMQSLGVDRDFFFVLPPYSEQLGAKDWGLMRRDFTVKPGYVAFSNLTFTLGSAKLEGSLELGDGLRGFLYRQPDGGQTLAYWSVSELDTEPNRPDRRITGQCRRSFALSVPKGVYAGTDIFGTPFQADASDGKLRLTSTRMIAYVNGLSGLKPAVPFRAVKKSGAPRRTEYDRTIVYRVRLSDDFVLSTGRDSVDTGKERAALKLEVWNLSDQPKTGRLKITGCQVEGLPGTVSVPAFGRTVLSLAITPEFGRDYTGAVKVSGTFDGRETSPLVMPVVAAAKLVRESRRTGLARSDRPEAWRPNASGQMTILRNDAENALKFHTRFSQGDFWVYPEFRLKLPQESLRGVYGISFEVKATPAAGVKQMLLMAVYGKQREHGEAVFLKVVPPSEKWEERVVPFPPGEVDPAKIEMLRLGLNSTVPDITYSVRNVRVIRTAK